VRELTGHLLLATAAVSKGHQVFIASPSDIWLFKRLNILSKGCYFLKNMNIPTSSKKKYDDFIKDGFDLYCQEQEPSILWSKFEKFVKLLNFKEDHVIPFKGVFCWGERDTEGYKNLFSSHKNIFFNTGSPRADLWHKQFMPLWDRNYISKLKPYILFVSNFGGVMGNTNWTELIKKVNKLELIETYEHEENFIKLFQEEHHIALEMILAIKHISIKFPELNIVVRPHPTEEVDYWRNIFTKEKNVVIASNSDPLTSWISSAKLVIHNGCTSALEAVLQKIPVISHGPERTHGDTGIPNQLGTRTKSKEELENTIIGIIKSDYENNSQVRSEEILKPLISTKNCDAAFRILDIMEKNSNFSNTINFNNTDLIKIRFIRKMKNIIDQVRKIFTGKDLVSANYNISKEIVTTDVKMISKILQINSPKIDFISKTGLLFRKQETRIGQTLLSK